ncbi:hypothetical protein [Halorientalis salina]|uniref:hypothetical protein n=1 Tax=Halorientalis salina TaxID=2932266 RepID=UPI0010ABF221|nr:hypothetical protein [Halorientalis salina]
MVRSPNRSRRVFAVAVLILLAVVGAAAVLATIGVPGLPFGPDGDGERLAPGVYENETVNVTRLLEAHQTQLRTSGFSAVTAVTSRTNGSVTVSSGQRVRASPNLTQVRVRQNRSTADGENVTAQVYSNETTTLVRQVVDGNESYQVRERTRGRTVPPISRATLTVLGQASGNFTVANVTETDGERRITLTADLPSGSSPSDARTQVSMVVDSQGVIHTLTVQSGREGGAQTIESAYRLRELGVESVDRPAWVSELPANATRRTPIDGQQPVGR